MLTSDFSTGQPGTQEAGDLDESAAGVGSGKGRAAADKSHVAPGSVYRRHESSASAVSRSADSVVVQGTAPHASNDDDDEEEEEAAAVAQLESDEELELNRMISNIGFGKYHRRVLALCGLGWTADNAWMQCTACILPRVQQHFGVSNARIGLMSSSMFLGLMCGALVWGPVSDRFGRLIPYRWTLVVSATFGLIASAMPSFSTLCVCLFGLGSGVGGNMPVDGAIFLEFVPREKRHLLTLLSVFFSLGSVLTSAVALAILPPFSCPDDPGPDGCDVSKQNNGWRYLLITMSLLTIVMVILRNGCFRLHETPKFLLQNRRRSDVVMVLKKIVTFNGGIVKQPPLGAAESGSHPGSYSREEVDAHSSLMMNGSPGPGAVDDDCTSTHSWLEWPETDAERERASLQSASGSARPHRTIRSWMDSLLLKAKSALDFSAHIRLLKPLFGPSLRRTTVLVWLIWGVVAMGFTMFNVFLPKLLESHGSGGSSESDPKEAATTGSHSKQVAVYRDSLIYAVSGVPGSILGAWLVDTRLGRIYSMVLSTSVSGLALIGFAFAAKAHISVLTVVASSVFGLTSTLMFAVIYAYTPEVFHPSVRGTACGMASAIGRVAGIVAPLITGLLLEVSVTVPLYVSVALLWAAAGLMFILPIETRDIAA
ncbi:hypothetical protein GGF46_002827 [Coemansia sp. RSA 552]|nr:hypothetical protein GGF46_002827 [Coemansia sp. RSA 552]